MPLTESVNLVLRNQLPADADAAAYIARVEGASGDNQALEPAVKFVITNFILGCKNDGIWNAIKASCILCGARTLNGALQPLVGTAPTNVGNAFVQADYNRKTGLLSSGSKYLNSNRANNADPQDNAHRAVYLTTARLGPSSLFGSKFGLSGYDDLADVAVRSRGALGSNVVNGNTGLHGTNRTGASAWTAKFGPVEVAYTTASSAPESSTIWIFARNFNDAPNNVNIHRIAFYSIGESLDLALLDARVTELINNIQAVTP